jgi:hypothetical protein
MPVNTSVAWRAYGALGDPRAPLWSGSTIGSRWEEHDMADVTDPARDPGEPTLVTRLAAVFRHEVSAKAVEAYRRAGKVAYEDMVRAEQLRDDLIGLGIDLWSAASGQRSQLLCAWNAYALQTLGDELVEADYRADPRTAGYLPSVTAEQAAAFLGEVEAWSARAHRAAVDPSYDIAAEQALPALLPRWVGAEPHPAPHLVAMLAAARSLRDRAEAALGAFSRYLVPAEHANDAAGLQGSVAAADSSVCYAESLWTPNADTVVRQRVESLLRRAVETYFRAGQLVGMPTLLDRPEIHVGGFTLVLLPPPGQPGFDPWCLTDPDSYSRWHRDPQARAAIHELWRHDPDPAITLAIQAQINAAVAAGAVARGVGPDGRRSPDRLCFHRCPWSSIYLARQPVVIDGHTLRPGDQFAFDVSAAEVAEGARFTRRLALGPFHPADGMDYPDPRNA